MNEYDHRLEEQVKLAKEDMLHELEVQIQVSLRIIVKRIIMVGIFFIFS